MAKQPFLDDPLISAAGTATQFFDTAGKIESLGDVVVGPITLSIGGAISGLSSISGSGAGGSIGSVTSDNLNCQNLTASLTVSFGSLTDGVTTVTAFQTTISDTDTQIPTSGAVVDYVSDQTSDFATVTYVNSAVSGLASTSYVDNAIATAIANHISALHDSA